MIVICCGNETFLCGNSELKTHKGFWFAVTYGVVLPWWVPKLRNVGKIPQQSCRILSLDLWFIYGACDRWCFFFQDLEFILKISHPWIDAHFYQKNTRSWLEMRAFVKKACFWCKHTGLNILWDDYTSGHSAPAALDAGRLRASLLKWYPGVYILQKL